MCDVGLKQNSSQNNPMFESVILKNFDNNIDFDEIKRCHNNVVSQIKPCLSVKSADHHIGQFQSYPIFKHENEISFCKLAHDLNIDNYDFNNSFDLSEKDFSVECMRLEDKLIQECDNVVEDLHNLINNIYY